MRNKWGIVLATAGIHASIGNVYAFSVLTKPIMETCGFTLTQTTLAFSGAILFLGISACLLSKYVDEYGPTKMGIVATICFTLGLFGSALAISMQSLSLLYLFYSVILGTGLGIGYTTPVSTLIKYFPNRPGMASGTAIMSFALGSVIASPVMQTLITSYNLITNFLILGFAYMIVMLFSSLYLAPPEDCKAETKEESIVCLKPKEVYHTWQFKVLFLIFYINVTAGISLLATISPMTQELFNFTPERAAGFVMIIAVLNCLGRFAWASFSDIITRKWTYILFFVIEAICFFLLAGTTNEYLFELLVLIIISCYGGGFSCLPPYLADLFTKQYLSTIHGRTLLAWGLAGTTAILAPLTRELTGSYHTILWLYGCWFIIALGMAWKLKGGSTIDDIRRS